MSSTDLNVCLQITWTPSNYDYNNDADQWKCSKVFCKQGRGDAKIRRKDYICLYYYLWFLLKSPLDCGLSKQCDIFNPAMNAQIRNYYIMGVWSLQKSGRENDMSSRASASLVTSNCVIYQLLFFNRSEWPQLYIMITATLYLLQVSTILRSI